MDDEDARFLGHVAVQGWAPDTALAARRRLCIALVHLGVPPHTVAAVVNALLAHVITTNW